MNLPGTFPPKVQEGVGDAVGEASFDFLDFQMHDHFDRMVALDGWRHGGRVGADGLFRTDNFRPRVLFAASAKCGQGQQHRCCNYRAFCCSFHILPPEDGFNGS